jgi:hypothetical protein
MGRIPYKEKSGLLEYPVASNTKKGFWSGTVWPSAVNTANATHAVSATAKEPNLASFMFFASLNMQRYYSDEIGFAVAAVTTSHACMAYFVLHP